MSLPYTMVFTLLMTEMITFIFLILPLPFKWRRGMLNFLSKSPFMAHIQYVMKIVFIFVFILFLDSLNRVIKVEEIVSDSDHHHHHHAHTDTSVAAKRFYAQRNMYLTGFTLFLSLILNRTFFTILDLIKSEEKMEVVKKQAAQQSKEYERLLESEKKLKKELEDLQKIASSHESTKQDLENLKKQASQQQQEYLRMADENSTLEKKLKGTKSENKKDI
ncbi:B-cell receptor-associated protein 31-like-domain-containing protein [Lobosporangium transversale]|uniref:Endoplasmic reticulum transmembrane protein n=1 Tax=Lobosporangium transversale TaxID=64571 RepID=A0A1Y2GW44_9FUNG|nr:B-cell receptor-associated protein 31-like-domain-containing protein [Lobosporangium transversale]ORZ26485.1 B-cell receptor-associated protein 31-like-domain-containing protein [Lobosporangium transversale]|eukprot:XP_021884250.1 B-cell receptor-associated protein 31-like-domain-containing protein [Lobosporangium transversale]